MSLSVHKENATGRQNPCCSCSKTAPSRFADVSALTLVVASVSYKAKTQGEHISSFNLRNGSLCMGVHIHSVLEFSNSLRGLDILAIFGENLHIWLRRVIS